MKQSSRLLISESPLQVQPSLAVAIGLNEAIFLQQLQYWLNTSRHERDGRKWIYNSTPEWIKQFPFWSESTLKRIVADLRERKLILTRNDLNARKMDKTLWYAIDYDVLDGVKLTPSSYQVDTMDSINLTPSIVSTCTDGEGQFDTTNTNRLPETTTEENKHTGKPASPKAKTEPHPNTKSIIEAYCDCLGYKPTNFGATGSAAKEIATRGYTAQDVRKVYPVLKSESFWKSKVLPLIKVLEKIEETNLTIRRRDSDNGQVGYDNQPTDAEVAEYNRLKQEGRDAEAAEFFRKVDARFRTVPNLQGHGVDSTANNRR